MIHANIANPTAVQPSGPSSGLQKEDGWAIVIGIGLE